MFTVRAFCGLFHSIAMATSLAAILFLAALTTAVGQSTPGPTSRPTPVDLPAIAPVLDCRQLQGVDFANVAEAPLRITSATVIEDGKPAPYCRVMGYISPQVQFEVRLPVSGWTQRFLQTGCGGLCGNTNIHVGNDEGCAPAERGELALASTNMGHNSAGDGVWGAIDPQLRIDFAYRGVHVTALAAKAIIEKYYGQKPKYSYFAGCSDGGREALMEAQRYPGDFNGITAGAPAMNFITQNTFYHGWNARVNTDAKGRAILTADKLPILHSAALTACDELDGLKDGLINDPTACHFDPAETQCKAGQDAAKCLTAAQVDAARQLYQGAHDAKGRQLVLSGPQVGSELAWKGVFVPNTPDDPIMSAQFAMGTIKYLAYPKNPPADYTLLDLHFDQAAFDELKPMHAIYDSTDPDLSKFAAHGSKLILWHGWSDPHISPLNSIVYYTSMQNLLGKSQVDQFARLYLFPGGYHCGGGDGPFNVDLLSAIMAWVERDSAPYKLIASHDTNHHSPVGPEDRVPEPAHVDRTRPVFPYPLVAKYTGNGSVDDAANFVAEAPKMKEAAKLDWLGSAFYSPGYEQWCTWEGMNFSCR